MALPNLKPCQYDSKIFEDGSVNKTLQIGIIDKISILSVLFNDDNPSPYRGLMILSYFLTPSSLFGIDFQIKGYSLSFSFFSKYFKGWVAWEADVRGEG